MTSETELNVLLTLSSDSMGLNVFPHLLAVYISPYENLFISPFLIELFWLPFVLFEFSVYSGCQTSARRIASRNLLEAAASSLAACAVPKPFNFMQLCLFVEPARKAPVLRS